MAAGVNVALCPWPVYRSYICPVREPRAISPRRNARGRTAVSSLFFCVRVLLLRPRIPLQVSRKHTFNCFLPVDLPGGTEGSQDDDFV